MTENPLTQLINKQVHPLDIPKPKGKSQNVFGATGLCLNMQDVRKAVDTYRQQKNRKGLDTH